MGDDAAAVEIGPVALVTADTLVEGVHFQRDATPPRLLGRKALSVNLSDIGAMGGISRYAAVSLCLPPQLEIGWLDALYDGLLERAAEADVAIVGGNLTRAAEAIVIDVTLLGDAKTTLLRSGARPGDRIVVTGTLGASAEGVKLLAEGARLSEDGGLASSGIWTDASAAAVAACLRAQLDPRPPLALASGIAEHALARAAMDLSDGLSSDLQQMCDQSGVGAVVDGAVVPIDPAMASIEGARGGAPLWVALHGGEEYQLLLAVDPALVDELRQLGTVFEVPVTDIGEFVAGPPQIRLRDGLAERPLAPRGYDHFGATSA
jgi:thiamine-monophosphate kinase